MKKAPSRQALGSCLVALSPLLLGLLGACGNDAPSDLPSPLDQVVVAARTGDASSLKGAFSADLYRRYGNDAGVAEIRARLGAYRSLSVSGSAEHYELTGIALGRSDAQPVASIGLRCSSQETVVFTRRVCSPAFIAGGGCIGGGPDDPNGQTCSPGVKVPASCHTYDHPVATYKASCSGKHREGKITVADVCHNQVALLPPPPFDSAQERTCRVTSLQWAK